MKCVKRILQEIEDCIDHCQTDNRIKSTEKNWENSFSSKLFVLTRLLGPFCQNSLHFLARDFLGISLLLFYDLLHNIIFCHWASYLWKIDSSKKSLDWSIFVFKYTIEFVFDCLSWSVRFRIALVTILHVIFNVSNLSIKNRPLKYSVQHFYARSMYNILSIQIYFINLDRWWMSE